MTTYAELVETVITAHAGRTRGKVTPINEGSSKRLIAKNSSDQGIFQAWPSLTEEIYEEIVDEADAAGLDGTYHVYGKSNLLITDDVVFYQMSLRRAAP